VLVWGAGGHGKVVAELVHLTKGLDLIGFADRDTDRVGKPFAGSWVVATESDLLESRPMTHSPKQVRLAHGIGDNQARWRAHELAGRERFVTLSHPTAVVSPAATIGRGTAILANAVINPGAVIGEAVILNTGCVIEHDSVVADGAHVSPGVVLAGGVTISRLAWIGAAACVVDGLTIGANAIVGAGSVVLNDVPAGATVVGNPSRVLERSR
jgi:sugar O-acyltransferase (sialic acid O-acetyltransferase NeuD family)